MVITSPTLLLDESKCRANIARMASKARASGVIFRPHCKTHQSHEVARWLREEGADRITVSSLRMAEYFAQDGWNDITVAFPVNVLESDRINRLASYVRINLVVESVEAVEELKRFLQYEAGFFVKADLGYHRTGVDPHNDALLDGILRAAEGVSKLEFRGFLGHAGHTYKARGPGAVAKIYRESTAMIAGLKSRYIDRYPDVISSIGDTPGCSVMEKLDGADEVRPGNFVFYDLAQRDIGSCSVDQIAVALACPAVAVHPERGEVVIYGGAVHFSKDRSTRPDGSDYYGIVARLGAGGWAVGDDPPVVKSLSQEHGIVTGSAEFVNSVKVGDVLAVLPIHSCLTANLMNFYRTLDGRRIDCLRLADL